MDKLTEKERQEIKEQAKNIMEIFGKTLEKVEKEAKEAAVEREKDRREEKEINSSDEEFRKNVFENAPKVKDECIVAEKGTWTG